MPDANELRQQTREARARMGRAIGAARDDWTDVADGGEWSVRATVEHALEVDLRFAGAVAGVIGVSAPAERAPVFESAEAAIAGLPEIERTVLAVLDRVTDADLEKVSPVLGTLYATMMLVAHHMNLHALQIAERSDPAQWGTRPR